MDPFTTALLAFAARFGINAAVAFLSSIGSTKEEAIAALRKAESVTLEEIIAEDAAQRLKSLAQSPRPDGA